MNLPPSFNQFLQHSMSSPAIGSPWAASELYWASESNNNNGGGHLPKPFAKPPLEEVHWVWSHAAGGKERGAGIEREFCASADFATR